MYPVSAAVDAAFPFQCNRGVGIDLSYQQLFRPQTTLMVLGPQCSSVAHPLIEATRSWNITFVTPLALSAGLSDRDLYPRLFRLSTSDISMVPARIALMKEWGWTKVALLHQQQNELFSTVTEEMASRMESRDWTVISQEVFGAEPWKNIKTLKAFKQDYYGSHIIWVFPSWFDDRWADFAPEFSNCSSKQILAVLNHSLYVGQMMYSPSKDIGVSGRTAESFESAFLEQTNGSWPIGSAFRIITYDSAWHAALALNRTLTTLIETGSKIRLEDFTYANENMADLISTSVSEVAFNGISGLIQFDETGSTHPLIVIQQQLGSTRKTIAYYDLDEAELTWVGGGAEWADGNPPRDSNLLVLRDIYVSDTLYAIMATIAVLGIIQAFGFFVFNTLYRSMRIIKMSSPNINNLVIAGSILCYTTVLFADVKGSVIPLTALCTIRLCTFTIGFSLAFGALFAKTWRVHAILTSRKRMKRNVKLDALNDSKLIGFSIYNVVTLSMLGVIIGATVDNDLNMSYGSLSALQLIGTAATLNIVFMPKIIAVHRGDSAVGPILGGKQSNIDHQTWASERSISTHKPATHVCVTAATQTILVIEIFFSEYSERKKVTEIRKP
ncbi:hypothetical protein CAPTEDRAFT_215191 [Capitella teleta]|uniref:G-protein coupled receptors family 3 profile domain-containing protein n=1 Tax=Capitella teleta TaxID=283909 RepID=R7TVE7_CAPTE|nr:hypothetical protein CAPTEDRAFT_215191 [Capitella teleta]|eukprot:ELT94990.1 hypothetical protein CAPTEDRAFT_215191 [Capitella teleta]